MKPFCLEPGDTIGVMAPSSWVDEKDIETSKKLLEDKGYHVFIHPQALLQHNQCAGTQEDKVAALYDLWDDEDIKCIWAAGGGNRGLLLLDNVDFRQLESPKLLIGYSDVTAILNGLYSMRGMHCVHGPTFGQLHKHNDLDFLFSFLEGNERELPMDGAQFLKPGHAQGHLIGGNLSIFQYLHQVLGAYFYTGGILFLEDCHEELSRIDRMFIHLKQCGVLSSIRGLILGEFSDIKDTGKPFGYSLEDIVLEHTHDLDIPIIMNAPFGHGEHLPPYPIGTIVRMAETNGAPSLKLKESAFTPPILI